MYNVYIPLTASDVNSMNATAQSTSMNPNDIRGFSYRTGVSEGTVRRWFGNVSTRRALVKSGAIGSAIAYWQGTTGGRGDQIRLYAGALLRSGIYADAETTGKTRIKQYQFETLADTSLRALEIVEFSFDNVLGALWTKMTASKVETNIWQLDLEYRDMTNDEGSDALVRRKERRYEAHQKNNPVESEEIWES